MTDDEQLTYRQRVDAVVRMLGADPDAFDPAHVDAVLSRTAAIIGMTVEQTINHVLCDEIRHPDAPPGVCGMASPRDRRVWCGEPADAAHVHVPSAESIEKAFDSARTKGHPMDPAFETLLGTAAPVPPRRHRDAPPGVCGFPDPDHPDRFCADAPHGDDAHGYGP